MRFFLFVVSVLRLLLTLRLPGIVWYIWAGWSGGRFTIWVPYLRRSIMIRGLTSDRWVLDSVIVRHEYRGFVRFTPRRIIDAGANIGCATVYWKSLFPDAEVLALEPDEENFRMVVENTRGLSRVTVEKAGLWSHSTHLRVIDPHAWKYSLQVVEDSSGKIRATCVESIPNERGWDFVDVLKLDIEGGEVAVLSGNVEAWIHRVNVLIIELHPSIAPTGTRLLCKALSQEDFQLSWRGEDLIATRINLLN